VSIAWSTIAFLVLLLPGFLFFVGLYLPENFTRETAPRSALGQLAAIVLVSFLVHGLAYSLSRTFVGPSINEFPPEINLGHILQLLQVEGLNDTEFAEVIASIERFHWWIFGYVLVTSGTGLLLGYETGSLIVAGPFRKLAEHGWVYDLKVEGAIERPPGFALRYWRSLDRLAWVPSVKSCPTSSADSDETMTFAYVLTDTSHDERFMIYRGVLRAFGISKDGKPNYLVLSNTLRSYMLLDAAKPATSEWRRIGGSSDGTPSLPGPKLSSYFVISGEHIVNVVFDKHGVRQVDEGERILDEAVKVVMEALEAEKRRSSSASDGANAGEHEQNKS
jgi:hypothetical protein